MGQSIHSGRWLAARLRHVTPRELPYRLRQQWTRLADRRWRPPATPPGPAPRWPWALTFAAEAGPDLSGWPGDTSDPRTAWEAARLQVFGPGREAAEQAVAFLGEHPPPGLAWDSTPEVALRLVSLVRLATAHPSPALRGAVHTHAAWIARHPSLGSSANNHRVAELGALALAAEVLPDLPEAAAWRGEARGLGEVLAAQLHPDGAGVEQSPTYLAYDLEWALVARGIGVPDELLRRGATFLAALLDGDGNCPALGDDDGGRVIATSAGPEDRYVRSVAGAVLGWTPDERARALGVAGGAVPSAPAPVTFPDGGLTVLRAGRAMAVFDHGPLGGARLAAHGHADALSVHLHVGGKAILRGRGTGRYLGDPAVRRFHRGTLAHPTVVVDGADQSRQHDHPFLWRTRANARLEHADLADGTATAVHDGYAGRGVVHRRTVTLHADRLELVDVLDGTGRHHVAVVLPFAPEVEPAVLAELPVRAIRGGAFPGPGWHSPAYGRWVEATTLLLEGHVRLPFRHRTVVPFG